MKYQLHIIFYLIYNRKNGIVNYDFAMCFYTERRTRVMIYRRYNIIIINIIIIVVIYFFHPLNVFPFFLDMCHMVCGDAIAIHIKKGGKDNRKVAKLPRFPVYIT